LLTVVRKSEVTIAFDTQHYLRVAGRLRDYDRRVEVTGDQAAQDERSAYLSSTYGAWATTARAIGNARGVTVRPLEGSSLRSTHTVVKPGGRTIEEEIREAAINCLEFQGKLAARLSHALGAAAYALGALVSVGERPQWERAAKAQAAVLAAELCRLDDHPSITQKAVDLMRVLWPRCQPEQGGQPDWWRSVIGVACAGPISVIDTHTVSHSTAAAILRVPRHNIGQMVKRGHLERDPDDGRVLRSTVLRRLDWRPWPRQVRSVATTHEHP
jgi:hypothetical protein